MKKIITIILTILISAVLIIHPYFIGKAIPTSNTTDYGIAIYLIDWLVGAGLEACIFGVGFLLFLLVKSVYTLVRSKIK